MPNDITVTSLSQQIKFLEVRLAELKAEEKVLEGRVGVLETKLALLQQSADSLNTTVNQITSTWVWFVRAFFGLLLAAAVAFLVAGGLKV